MATMKFVSLMVGLVGSTLFFHSIFRSLVSGFDFSHKDSCLSHHGPVFLLFMFSCYGVDSELQSHYLIKLT